MEATRFGGSDVTGAGARPGGRPRRRPISGARHVMTTTAPRPTKPELSDNGRGRRWPLAAAASAVAVVGLVARRFRNGGTTTAPPGPPPLKVPRRGTVRRPIWSAATARATITARHLRTDAWWVQPLITGV